MMYMKITITLLVFLTQCGVVYGHARLTQPPSRSSMWRFGFKNPQNVDDASGFCGGFQTQWKIHGGKCGICGDSLSDPPPRANEAGGKYANGIIVATYEVGQTIEVKTHLTANHKGYYEFRLCDNDDPKATVEQECFDKHLLQGENGETKFTIVPTMVHVTHKVKLPPGLSCKACILQWKYNTGNSWGTDPATGKGCSGCGPQETFQACADIAIGSDDTETGSTDTPFEVPEGDEDERENVKDSDEYDETGRCTCQAVASAAMCHSLPVQTWSNRH